MTWRKLRSAGGRKQPSQGNGPRTPWLEPGEPDGEWGEMETEREAGADHTGCCRP